MHHCFPVFEPIMSILELEHNKGEREGKESIIFATEMTTLSPEQTFFRLAITKYEV